MYYLHLVDFEAYTHTYLFYYPQIRLYFHFAL